jgi:hypothetical protein
MPCSVLISRNDNPYSGDLSRWVLWVGDINKVFSPAEYATCVVVKLTAIDREQVLEFISNHDTLGNYVGRKWRLKLSWFNTIVSNGGVYTYNGTVSQLKSTIFDSVK